MSWFKDIITGGVDKVVDSVASGLDNLFTSDDERLKARNMLEQIRNQMKTALVASFTQVISDKKEVIIAEMGGNWLQRSWRPLLMLLFGFIVANEYIISPYVRAIFSTELPVKPISADMWALLKLGVGGYISGRSIEKAVAIWSQGKKA